MINDGTHTYTYDAENRMITVDGSAQIYFYDAFGRQTQAVYGGNTYSRIFGLNGRAEVQFIGNSWMLSELYAGSVGGYLGNYSNNKTYFAHSDQVGSRRMYTDPSGSAVETCTGLPFGDAGTCAGSGPASPTGFTGQDWDPNTNLTRFPFRNYSMQQGRWMHPDPAGLAAVDPSNPQTWNRYAYVSDNPLSFVDPLGLRMCEITRGVCGSSDPGDGGGDSCNGDPWCGCPDCFGSGFGGGNSGSSWVDLSGMLCGEEIGLPCGLPSGSTGFQLPCDFGYCGPQIGNDFISGVTGNGTPGSPYTISVLVLASFLQNILGSSAANNVTNCAPGTKGCFNVPQRPAPPLTPRACDAWDTAAAAATCVTPSLFVTGLACRVTARVPAPFNPWVSAVCIGGVFGASEYKCTQIWKTNYLNCQ